MSEARRQLAAIVFTDAVGSTQSMRDDEEATLAMLRRHHDLMRESCAHFQGEVLKTTGDGLMMLFVSASQAVLCALDIQAKLRDSGDSIRHRIGVHLGDVVVSEGDAHGDGVNIAARLEQMADPGTVCLSKTVLDVVRGRLSFEPTPLGPRELKGLNEVIEVFRVAPGDPQKKRRAPKMAIHFGAMGVVAVTIVAVTAMITKPWQSSAPATPALSPKAALESDPDFRDSVLEVLRETAKEAEKEAQAQPKDSKGNAPIKPVTKVLAEPRPAPSPTPKPSSVPKSATNTMEPAPASPSKPLDVQDLSPDPAQVETALREAVAEQPTAQPENPPTSGLQGYEEQAKKHWEQRDFEGMLSWMQNQPWVSSPEGKKAIRHWQLMSDFKVWYLSSLLQYKESNPLVVGGSDPKKSFKFWSNADQEIFFVGPGGKVRHYGFAALPIRFLQLSAPPMLDDASAPVNMMKGLSAMRQEMNRQKAPAAKPGP